MLICTVNPPLMAHCTCSRLLQIRKAAAGHIALPRRGYAVSIIELGKGLGQAAEAESSMLEAVPRLQDLQYVMALNNMEPAGGQVH